MPRRMITTAPARHPWLRAGLVTLFMLVLAMLGASPAHAHAELVGTDPSDGAVRQTAPEVVILTFNEPVSPVEGALTLFEPGGRSVRVTAVSRDRQVRITMPTSMGEGTYQLVWRVASDDGHPINGVLTFHIGQPGTTNPAAATVRDNTAVGNLVTALTGLQYLGLLLGAGMATFTVLVQQGTALGDRFDRQVRRIATWAWVVAVLAAALLVPFQTVRVLGLGPGTVVRPSHWWPDVLEAQLFALAFMVVGAVGAVLLRRLRIGALVAVAAALVAPALIGHTRTVPPIPVMALVDWVHLATAAVWLGGLVCLVVAARARPDDDSGGTLATMVARFSGVAVVSVGVLAAAGVLMAWLVTRDLWSLPSTNYGRTLLVKVALVAVAVALASWNRFGLLPWLRRQPGDRAPAMRLRRVLLAEAGVLVLVVAVTGSLTQLTPHPSVAGPSGGTAAEVRVTSQGLSVEGTITPLLAGANTFEMTLAYHGAPVAGGQVEVTASLPEKQLGPLPAAVTPVEGTPGRYRVELTLPTAGVWQVHVGARVSQFEQPVAVVRVPVR
ncbi:copper resistance protein CopC [Propionibacteriaceae bacterium G1746]